MERPESSNSCSGKRLYSTSVDNRVNRVRTKAYRRKTKRYHVTEKKSFKRLLSTMKRSKLFRKLKFKNRQKSSMCLIQNVEQGEQSKKELEKVYSKKSSGAKCHPGDDFRYSDTKPRNFKSNELNILNEVINYIYSLKKIITSKEEGKVAIIEKGILNLDIS